jgi:predicted transcriptional regulator
VTGYGTGGTVSGVGRVLRRERPEVKIILSEAANAQLVGSGNPQERGSNGAPAGSHPAFQPHPIQGWTPDFIPLVLQEAIDQSYYDELIPIAGDVGMRWARELAAKEGIFTGVSGGSTFGITMQVAERAEPGSVILCMLPDTGERYLSKLYSDEWMRENQMLEHDRVTLGQLMEAKDGRTERDVIFVAPGTSVRQALRLMSLHDVSQLPVMDGADCVGSVSDWSLSAKSLDNTKLLDSTVSDVMDSPFPVVDANQPVDAVVKLLSKSSPAILVREADTVQGILTRSDMLHYVMGR